MSIEQPSFEQPTSKNESLRVEIREKLKKIIPNLFPLSTQHQEQANASGTNPLTETLGDSINQAEEEPIKTEVV